MVMKKDTEEYFLALTGGGMDLSQDIALAYIIAQGWIPTALAYEVSTQPELSVSGDDSRGDIGKTTHFWLSRNTHFLFFPRKRLTFFFKVW